MSGEEKRRKLKEAAEILGKTLFPDNHDQMAEFIIGYFTVVLKGIRNDPTIMMTDYNDYFLDFIDHLYKAKLYAFADEIYTSTTVDVFSDIAAKTAERYNPDIAAIVTAKELWYERYGATSKVKVVNLDEESPSD